jgi:hypothetical protein
MYLRQSLFCTPYRGETFKKAPGRAFFGGSDVIPPPEINDLARRGVFELEIRAFRRCSKPAVRL